MPSDPTCRRCGSFLARAEKAERALAEMLAITEMRRIGIRMDGSEQWVNPTFGQIAEIARAALRPSEEDSDPFSGEPGTSSSAGGSWGHR